MTLSLPVIRSQIGNAARGCMAHLPQLALLAAVNFLIYHEYWLGRRIITSKDFLTAFYPLLNFQSDCLQELSWPLWNPFMNFGYPFVEHYINTALFPSHLLMGLVTGSNLTIIHWELLAWIIAGGFGVYLCIREFGHSSLTAVIGGVSFMFCSQMLTLPQWSLIVYNACSFPYLVLGYHRSVRSKNPFSLLSIGFLAMMILGGYLSTMVYGMYIFGGYVIADSLLQKNVRHGITYLVLTFAGALLLSLPKTGPLYNAMQSGPRISTYAPTPDPFNIVNFHDFPSYLLPVKFYFSLFIGSASVIALCYGALKRQMPVNALLMFAILTGWLFMVDRHGSVSLLRSMSYVLPLMKTARNEWLNWYYPSLFAILYLSRHVDRYLGEGDRNYSAAAVAAFIVLLSAVFVGEYAVSVHYQAYLVHVALAAGWLGAARLSGRRTAQGALAVLLVAAEFLLVFNRVSVDEPPLRYDDRIQVLVTHQVGASRSFLDDQQVSQTFVGEFSDDRRRPPVSESRNWPVLVSGLGGAPGYNMFPQQYTLFIDAMNFKRFSGWWHNTQERYEFEKVKDSPLLTQLDGQPLFGYFSGITRAELPGAVSFDDVSCSDFQFTVRSGEPGFFLLRQMYDPRWRAVIDGAETRPVRANRYFMGVEVGPGVHRVRFLFRDTAFFLLLAAAGVTLAGLIAAAVFRRRRSPPGRAT